MGQQSGPAEPSASIGDIVAEGVELATAAEPTRGLGAQTIVQPCEQKSARGRDAILAAMDVRVKANLAHPK